MSGCEPMIALSAGEPEPAGGAGAQHVDKGATLGRVGSPTAAADLAGGFGLPDARSLTSVLEQRLLRRIQALPVGLSGRPIHHARP
jgi:hypothetical protein